MLGRLRWGGFRSAVSLLVLRLLLIANGCLLGIVGVLYLIFGARPEGLIVGAVVLVVAGGLFVCLPLTDPYRGERRSSGERPARW